LIYGLKKSAQNSILSTPLLADPKTPKPRAVPGEDAGFGMIYGNQRPTAGGLYYFR
jgi:hypothetical protein